MSLLLENCDFIGAFAGFGGRAAYLWRLQCYVYCLCEYDFAWGARTTFYQPRQPWLAAAFDTHKRAFCRGALPRNARARVVEPASEAADRRPGMLPCGDFPTIRKDSGGTRVVLAKFAAPLVPPPAVAQFESSSGASASQGQPLRDVRLGDSNAAERRVGK